MHAGRNLPEDQEKDPISISAKLLFYDKIHHGFGYVRKKSRKLSKIGVTSIRNLAEAKRSSLWWSMVHSGSAYVTISLNQDLPK